MGWICERMPPPCSLLRGRPSADKHKVVQGIFWILDKGAKWEERSRLLLTLCAKRTVANAGYAVRLNVSSVSLLGSLVTT